MLYLSIVLTLFALMAGMMLLAKTRKDGLGKFFSAISYFVIIVSLLLIVCQGTHGIMRMCCHRNCGPMEQGICTPGMMHGECGPGGGMMMRHGWMGGHGRYMEEMEMCKTMKDSACCMGDKNHAHMSCPMGGDKMMKDSVKK